MQPTLIMVLPIMNVHNRVLITDGSWSYVWFPSQCWRLCWPEETTESVASEDTEAATARYLVYGGSGATCHLCLVRSFWILIHFVFIFMITSKPHSFCPTFCLFHNWYSAFISSTKIIYCHCNHCLRSLWWGAPWTGTYSAASERGTTRVRHHRRSSAWKMKSVQF